MNTPWKINSIGFGYMSSLSFTKAGGLHWISINFTPPKGEGKKKHPSSDIHRKTPVKLDGLVWKRHEKWHIGITRHPHAGHHTSLAYLAGNPLLINMPSGGSHWLSAGLFSG